MFYESLEKALNFAKDNRKDILINISEYCKLKIDYEADRADIDEIFRKLTILEQLSWIGKRIVNFESIDYFKIELSSDATIDLEIEEAKKKEMIEEIEILFEPHTVIIPAGKISDALLLKGVPPDEINEFYEKFIEICKKLYEDISQNNDLSVETKIKEINHYIKKLGLDSRFKLRGQYLKNKDKGKYLVVEDIENKSQKVN
jgi:hypothetical protein